MKINKILNNNYVTSYNDDTGEIVVMGPGVGFRKKAGNTIDNNKIEKIFYLPLGREMETISLFITNWHEILQRWHR